MTEKVRASLVLRQPTHITNEAGEILATLYPKEPGFTMEFDFEPVRVTTRAWPRSTGQTEEPEYGQELLLPNVREIKVKAAWTDVKTKGLEERLEQML